MTWHHDQKPGARYLRFERDGEFRERLRVIGAPHYMLVSKAHDTLDEYAWDSHRMQRRIVEDEA
jgi:hypothetical protein